MAEYREPTELEKTENPTITLNLSLLETIDLRRAIKSYLRTGDLKGEYEDVRINLLRVLREIEGE